MAKDEITGVQQSNLGKLERALKELKGFYLTSRFATRDGYCARFHRQPPQTEPLFDDNPKQAQIYRFIIGPGNAICGDIQQDGTIELQLRKDFASSIINVAEAVEGYRTLRKQLDATGTQYKSDEALDKVLYEAVTSLTSSNSYQSL